MVKFALTRTLRLDRPHSLSLMIPQWIAEPLIKFQRNYRLRQLVEVASENVRGIVDCISSPVQTFAIAVWAVESDLELLDALLASGKSEDALNISCYARESARLEARHPASARITFILEEDSALGDDDWHIAVDVALTLFIKQADRNVCISYAGLERDTKDTWCCD